MCNIAPEVIRVGGYGSIAVFTGQYIALYIVSVLNYYRTVTVFYLCKITIYLVTLPVLYQTVSRE